MSFSQKDKRLEQHLIKKYSSSKGLNFGNFYFDSTQKVVRYIDSTLDKQLNHYQFYVCDLLSMGCWAPQYYKCIIAYNPTQDSSAIFPPLWYSGIDQPFCKLFGLAKTNDKLAFEQYVYSICKLLETTSTDMKFENPISTNSNTTYVLTQVMNNKKRNWRIVEFDFDNDYRLQEIKEINPITLDKEF